MDFTQEKLNNALFKQYIGLYYVDIEKDSFVSVSIASYIQKFVQSISSARKLICTAMQAIVTPKYKNAILRFMDLDSIAKRMKFTDTLSYDFIEVSNQWCRCYIIASKRDLNGCVTEIVIGIKNINEDKKHERKLIELSEFDELTKLKNRNSYEQFLQQIKSNNSANKISLVVAIDVNNLKTINDKFGHKAGDEIICGAANIIDNVLGKYGQCYRTGGDEFIAILTKEHPPISELKENLKIEEKKWHGILIDSISLSVGFSNNNDNSIEKSIEAADKMMYTEKERYYISIGVDKNLYNDAVPVLLSSYEKILKANLTKDTYEVIYVDKHTLKKIKYIDKSITSLAQEYLSNGTVLKSDSVSYKNAISIKSLQERFKKDKSTFRYSYHRKIGENFCKVLVEVTPLSEYTDENQIVLFSVKNIEE